MRPLVRNLVASVLGFAGVLAVTPARGQAIGQGFELERQGRLPQAADAYRSVLRTDSTNLAALLGLERVLPQLARLEDLLPLVQRAVAATGEQQPQLIGLELRTYVALRRSDSVTAVATRWTRRTPGDETPWREWAVALLDQQDVAGARRVLLDGRAAVHLPRAFAIELAEIAQSTGDWSAAAENWGDAVTTDAGQIPNALAQLGTAPEGNRPAIATVLTRADQSVRERRLAADLLLDWGDGARAWTVFAGTIQDSSRETTMALWAFAERGASAKAPTALEARGRALARFADLVPAPLAARARADAARALLAAGNRAEARVQLERLAADTTSGGTVGAPGGTQGALIEVLIADGELDAAEQRLTSLGGRLGGEDAERIRLELAWARVARGELDRGERILAPDSSIEAIAVRGWIALYRGDLGSAQERFREAGPYAGDRAEATQRTAMLALIGGLGTRTSPELGGALLLLARGDSAGAVASLRKVADGLAPEGQGEVLLLAGRVAAALGPSSEALAADLLARVVGAGGAGAAPAAAELVWAQLLERQGKSAEAITHLEHVILTYPQSAVIPEARRELERVKGAVPRS